MLRGSSRFVLFTPVAKSWPGILPLAVAVLAVAGLFGCAQQPDRSTTPAAAPRTTGSAWALPTSTMAWNDYACDLIARNQVGQFPALRTLAYVNLAINNALVAAKQQGKRGDGAAAGAAATVLVYMFPKDEAAINARLAGEGAGVGNDGRAAFSAGVDVGRAAGADVVAMAKTDRSDLGWEGVVAAGVSQQRV